jgi:hypothetical protein
VVLFNKQHKVFLLEGENRRMVRALVREVGEDVPLQRVLQDEAASDWRGRREQIVALRHTVQQLRQQLAAAATASSDGATTTQQAPPGDKHETAHRSVIGKLNKQKDAELARMASELEAAKGAAEQLRLQFTGASSRRKVLEAEVTLVCQSSDGDVHVLCAMLLFFVWWWRGGMGQRSRAAG